VLDQSSNAYDEIVWRNRQGAERLVAALPADSPSLPDYSPAPAKQLADTKQAALALIVPRAVRRGTGVGRDRRPRRRNTDVTLEVRLLQADALRAQDMPDAALEAYRDALRSKKRDLGS